MKIASQRAQKRAQKEKLDELKRALESDKRSEIRKELRYFVELPTEDAHQSHETGVKAGFSHRLHPSISLKITELVSAGITNTQEVKKFLRYFVTTTLAKDLGIQPQVYNRAYFPTDADIMNHVSSARKAFSQLDQHNLVEQIKKWQKESNGASFYFRPFKMTKSAIVTKDK